MTWTQLCESKEWRRVVADRAYLQVPELMRYGDLGFGGEDFDLLAQLRRPYQQRRRIDSIRRGTRNAIGADRARLRERDMAIYQANRFVGPVMGGVLMSVDARERREHRYAKNAEQHLDNAKGRSNSAIAVHISRGSSPTAYIVCNTFVTLVVSGNRLSISIGASKAVSDASSAAAHRLNRT